MASAAFAVRERWGAARRYLSTRAERRLLAEKRKRLTASYPPYWGSPEYARESLRRIAEREDREKQAGRRPPS